MWRDFTLLSHSEFNSGLAIRCKHVRYEIGRFANRANNKLVPQHQARRADVDGQGSLGRKLIHPHVGSAVVLWPHEIDSDGRLADHRTLRIAIEVSRGLYPRSTSTTIPSVTIY